MKSFGAIPSEHDPRDYVLSMLTVTKTEHSETFRRPFSGEVKNQEEIGSCVAHSLSYICEEAEEVESGIFKEFSVGFIYADREDSLVGEGMVPRDALNNLVKHGNVLYDDFPVNDTYPTVAALVNADRESLFAKAIIHKALSYVKVTTIDEIKTALEDVGLVTICCPIHTSFMTTQGGRIPVPDRKNEPQLGYHEMTIIGWDKDSWYVLNSWGKEWGDNGYCYLPYEYPIIEAWSVTDAINVSISPFVTKVLPGALRCYREFGILPSVTLSQACLESGWGESAPGNMLFGVKWSEGCGYDKQYLWTWEYLDGKWVHVQAYFRKYASYEESILDHAKLLNKSRYAPVREAKDYKTACVQLQACGYATSPSYATSLISIIEKYGLNKWDGRIYSMYKDADKISAWAKPYVEKAKDYGLMIGDDAGNFNPQVPITREQLAKVAVELYEKRNKV